MPGSNILCTEKWMADNFYPNAGISRGTDDVIMLTVAEVLARYQVSLSVSKASDLCPFQNEIVSTALVLGQSYGGGTICYLDDTALHGMICSNVFMSASGNSFLRWFNGANRALCYTFQSIGYGMANTNNIISTIGASAEAASACKNYRGGGYSDWFLPSQDEMGWLIYCKRMGLLPGFIDGVSYALWTSTEQGVVYAIAYNDTPYIFAEDDYLQHYVRAMRSF